MQDEGFFSLLLRGAFFLSLPAISAAPYACGHTPAKRSDATSYFITISHDFANLNDFGQQFQMPAIFDYFRYFTDIDCWHYPYASRLQPFAAFDMPLLLLALPGSISCISFSISAMIA